MTQRCRKRGLSHLVCSSHGEQPLRAVAGIRLARGREDTLPRTWARRVCEFAKAEGSCLGHVGCSDCWRTSSLDCSRRSPIRLHGAKGRRGASLEAPSAPSENTRSGRDADVGDDTGKLLKTARRSLLCTPECIVVRSRGHTFLWGAIESWRLQTTNVYPEVWLCTPKRASPTLAPWTEGSVECYCY